MTEVDNFSWLVGWLEGEGTFYCSALPETKTRKSYKRLVVRGVSVDKEICVRMQQIAGGRIHGPYKYTDNRQYHWQWYLGGSKENVVGFMWLVYPHMGIRRQQQIREAIEKAEIW